MLSITLVYVIFIKNPHPDDISYFFSSSDYFESDDFFYKSVSLEFNITVSNIFLRIYDENAQVMLILPETLGNQYLQSIQNLIKL